MRVAAVLAVAAGLVSAVAAYQGPFCATGITDEVDSACCPAHCDSCGACNCAFHGDAIQGGEDYCCPQRIHQNNLWCAAPTDVGCVLQDVAPKKVRCAGPGDGPLQPSYDAEWDTKPVETAHSASVSCRVVPEGILATPKVSGNYSFLSYTVYMATDAIIDALMLAPTQPAHDLEKNLDWKDLAEAAVPRVTEHPVVQRMHDVFNVDINSVRAVQAPRVQAVRWYNNEESEVTGVRPTDWVAHGFLIDGVANSIPVPGLGSFAIVVSAKDVLGARVDAGYMANFCLLDVTEADAPEAKPYKRPALFVPDPFDIAHKLTPHEASGAALQEGF